MTTSPERLQRFFTKTDGGYQVSKMVRDMCVFARQDLTRDPPFSHLDLVSCRNVMIYFDRTLQSRVFRLFCESLPMYGILAVGSKESLRFSKYEPCYERLHAHEKIYRKVK